jgi:hypothetical protein
MKNFGLRIGDCGLKKNPKSEIKNPKSEIKKKGQIPGLPDLNINSHK